MAVDDDSKVTGRVDDLDMRRHDQDVNDVNRPDLLTGTQPHDSSLAWVEA